MRKVNLFILILVGLFFTGSVYSAYEFKSFQLAPSPSNGKILQTDGTNNSWVTNSAASFPAQLGQIGDVSTTTLGYGSLLRYNSNNSKWESAATSTLGLTLAETDPVWTAVSGNYLLTANAFTQALASTTFQPIIPANTYDLYGQATNTLATHTGTYTHANYDTAYGWGNHAGLYDLYGQATNTLDTFLQPFYATTTHAHVSSLPSLTITSAQMSDIANYWDNRFNGTTTDGLSEGTNNLYWTSGRFDTSFGAKSTVGTSSAAVISNIPYFSSANTFANVATGTISGAGGITVTANRGAIGGTLAISCTAADTNNTGCLSDTDWDTFNGKLSGIGSGTNGSIAYWRGANDLAGMNTTTLSGSGPIAFDSPVVVIGYDPILAECSAASAAQTGCLSAANWISFNNKWDLASTSIGTAYGGTGLVAGGLKSTFIPYGNGTSAFSTSTNLYFTSTTNNLYAKYASTTMLTASLGFLSQASSTVVGKFTTTNASTTALSVNGSAIMTFYTMVAGHATSSWTATTTIFLGPAAANLTVQGAYCETNTGTVGVSLYDGTNRANYIATASTTINYFAYGTNNVFTAGESIRVDIGTPASSPLKVTCRFKYKY